MNVLQQIGQVKISLKPSNGELTFFKAGAGLFSSRLFGRDAMAIPDINC